MTPSDHSALDLITKCPFCSASYDEERLRTLKKEGKREVVHATCLSCSRAMLYTLERSAHHLSCIGLFTDCDASDALRFMKKKPLTLDDVLDAHILLTALVK